MKKYLSILMAFYSGTGTYANDEINVNLFAQYDTVQEICRTDVQDPSQPKYGLIVMQQLGFSDEQEFRRFLSTVKQESGDFSDLYFKADYLLDNFDNQIFWSDQGYLNHIPTLRP